MRTGVVIIGAGMAGLATGALLAKQGERVVVLEKGNVPGGRAYTYEEKGFTLNYGPHAVYRPQSGFLGELMARLERPVPECGFPDASKSYWADGARFASIGSKPHQALLTGLFSLRSKPALGKLFMHLRSEKPERLPDELTWGEWVDGIVGDASIRRFARALGTVNTYTRPSSALSAKFLLAHLQRSMFANDYVGYMRGGWRMMYGVWTEEIERTGAVITGARVDELQLDDGRIVAAIADGERYEADMFVCALPPDDATALAAAGSPLGRELAAWSGLVDARACCMDLGFSRVIRDDLTFIFDIGQDLYYSVHSATAPDLAPAGGQLLHAMAYLSPEEAADDALLQGRKHDLVAGLDRWFAGWRDALAVERTLPDARVISARSTPGQFGRNRVPLRPASASNLYFAGDARDLPYNLTEVCLASAMEVADAIAAGSAAAAAAAPALAG